MHSTHRATQRTRDLPDLHKERPVLTPSMTDVHSDSTQRQSTHNLGLATSLQHLLPHHFHLDTHPLIDSHLALIRLLTPTPHTLLHLFLLPRTRPDQPHLDHLTRIAFLHLALASCRPLSSFTSPYRSYLHSSPTPSLSRQHCSSQHPRSSPTMIAAVHTQTPPPGGLIDERPGRYERPYCSPRLARSRSRPRPGAVNAPTREFAARVAEIARHRKEQASAMGLSPSSPGGRERSAIEFVVDVPVWSLGCFSDLSTMHALRDATLAHVHTLIGHLAEEHSIIATYRLLARRPNASAWGSIRVVPSLLDGGSSRASRRTSFVMATRSPALEGAVLEEEEHLANTQLTEKSADLSKKTSSNSTSAPVVVPGYTKDSSKDSADGDDNDDDEVAYEELVRAEVEARGLEGTAFVVTIKDQLTLVLV